MKSPIMFLAAVLFASACARGRQLSKTPTTTEQIRAVLCAIDQNSYEVAQEKLERLLASDPKNADYQKALLGVQVRQVKRGEHSAQNIALIKKTIAGYDQALKNLQLTSDERRWVNSSLFFLFGELGEEELKKGLLKAQAETEKASPQSEDPNKQDSLTTEEADQMAKDLIELKRENSFDKVASELLLIPSELSSLVVPVDGSPKQKQSDKNPPTGSHAQQQYAWKSFAANDDLALDLPENVRPTAGEGYTAASEGVVYSVVTVPGGSDHTERQVVSGVLNTLARAQARFFSWAWLGQALANRYELKFVRSEDAGGEQRKIYAYSLISCGQRKEGLMVVQASRSHYYTIDINGVGESDPRAQRVLTSIKVK